MGKVIRDTLIAVAALIIWGFIVYQAMIEPPTVVKSAATRDCVRVISTSPYHSCGNLPLKYEVTWTD